jgi:hypothetical protein
MVPLEAFSGMDDLSRGEKNSGHQVDPVAVLIGDLGEQRRAWRSPDLPPAFEAEGVEQVPEQGNARR